MLYALPVEPVAAKAKPKHRAVMLNLCRLMHDKGFNGQKLAKAAHVRPNTVSNLLATGRADLETLEGVAKALDTPLEELFWSDRTRVVMEDHRRRQAILEELQGGLVLEAPAPRTRKRPMR
jgi:transcriptional regulator with XRE-family HTH domain